MGGGSHHRGASHRIGDIWPADARSSLALPFVSYSGPRHRPNSPFRPCWQSHPSSYCVSTVSILQPGNFAISVVLLTGMAWISPAQWGARTWAAFLFVYLACLVLSRTKRTDVANTFLVTYIAIVLGHAFYLGDPLSIPLKQMQSEALFTFFMITDPKTTQTGAAPGCCLPSEAIAPAVVFLASDDAYIVSADVIVGNIATDNG
jgi:hypothetical protein